MPPHDRFDRFTDRVRKVLTLAQAEAQRVDHAGIGAEHPSPGLTRQMDRPACTPTSVRAP